MLLTDIFRHPVKGLAPERLEKITLEAHKPLPWDRTYALAHKTSKFDPQNPAWVKRNNFVVVALSPKLATMQSHMDDATGLFHVTDIHKKLYRLDLTSPGDQKKLCDIIETHTQEAQAGPYQLVRLKDGHLADNNTNTLSLLNGVSLREISATTGIDISKRRWRGNLWFDGAPAFSELGWIGRDISIGTARLKITERIKRCAATSANITTGQRDIDMPTHLYKIYGHRDFGVLAEVIEGGTIRSGAPVKLLPLYT